MKRNTYLCEEFKAMFYPHFNKSILVTCDIGDYVRTKGFLGNIALKCQLLNRTRCRALACTITSKPNQTKQKKKQCHTKS